MIREEAIKELKRIVVDYKIEDVVRGGLLSWQKRRLDMIEIIIKDIQKQIPKKPILKNQEDLFGIGIWYCPVCGDELISDWNKDIANPYCHHCGQAIDWRDEE